MTESILLLKRHVNSHRRWSSFILKDAASWHSITKRPISRRGCIVGADPSRHGSLSFRFLASSGTIFFFLRHKKQQNIDLPAVSCFILKNFLLFHVRPQCSRYRECHRQTTLYCRRNYFSRSNYVESNLVPIITLGYSSGTLRSTPGRLGLSPYPQVSILNVNDNKVCLFFRSKYFERECVLLFEQLPRLQQTWRSASEKRYKWHGILLLLVELLDTK